MKLLQINAWSGRLLKLLTELIQQEKPDFICMQEVVSLDAEIHSLLGTLEEMQKDTNYKYQHYSKVFQFKLMNMQALWGNCILSNFPIMKKETVFTNLRFVKDFNFEEYDYNIRNLQHVIVDLGNKKLNILNHHGHHIPDHKNGDAQTLKQMGIVGEYLDKLSGPVILTGDFNLAPHSQSLGLINDRLKNLSVEYKLQTTRTPLTHKKEVCDYIFVNDEIRVRRFSASDELVSDHKALILEFDI